ncbi:MAG: class I SAM-dependent methyltransferase [Solirubrobacteraceae bacterium]
MATAEQNLTAQHVVRALQRGDLPWTLHPECDYANDPGQWGASLINHAEVMVGCLDAAGATSVVEIGAYAGDLTRFLLGWASGHGASVAAIDPSPQPELAALAQERPELTLIEATSHEALSEMEPADAYVIDGDHNYYTVAEEIRLITAGGNTPLLLFHDVGWPHGRRDDYFAPEQIPEASRQPTVEGGGLFPGSSAPQPGGLPYRWPADHEGGPGNGVLTAVEDFVAEHDGLVLAVVPAFFGLGIVWSKDAPYAQRLADLLRPLDRNPLLERMEANRAFHLASMHVQLKAIGEAYERLGRQETVMRRILTSSAFRLAEALSRLRVRAGVATGSEAVSREEIERALAPKPPPSP